MDEDPYRSGHQVGTCPRCQNPTESDGELDRMVCVRGCGEWYARERLADVLSWDELNRDPGGIGPDGTHAQATSWPWGPAQCAVCQGDMKVGFRVGVRFDFCPNHGLWLDAGEIQTFAQAFKLS